MDRADSDVGRQLQDARRRQPEALAPLLEQYRNYLMLMAGTGINASLQGKADASDVVQDTLLKAYERFGQFQGQTEAELMAWLRQILARNLADLVRRYRSSEGRNVGRERSLEAALDASSAALGTLVAGENSTPSQSAQRRELGVVLADALASLTVDYREVIVLRSIEEREWDEIAQRMGRSPGAVRMLWTRALQQLKPLIEDRL
jgi:RNA polymerase sigma-70 factor (ECF subfamily)